MNPGGEHPERDRPASARPEWRDFAATLLEAAGPLSLLGAQAIYMMEPFVPGRRSRIRALARALEDPESLSRWAEQLRRGDGR